MRNRMPMADMPDWCLDHHWRSIMMQSGFSWGRARARGGVTRIAQVMVAIRGLEGLNILSDLCICQAQNQQKILAIRGPIMAPNYSQLSLKLGLHMSPEVGPKQSRFGCQKELDLSGYMNLGT